MPSLAVRAFDVVVPFVLALALLANVANGQPTGSPGPPRNVQELLGPDFGANSNVAREPQKARPHDTSPRGMLHHWNGVAIDASGLDHTPVADGEARTFGEQLGPTRASRAMAIVHIAVFDAVNAIAGKYKSYTGLPRATPGTSMEAAIAQAARDTLSALFPSQRAAYDAQLSLDLARIHGTRSKDLGIDLGKRAAAAILAMRANDGSARAEPRVGIEYITDSAPGSWQQDPIGRSPVALGAFWSDVKPFVMARGEQFRAPPPPALGSAEYAEAFAEAKALGGDGIKTRTIRTVDQAEVGTFWAYDGTPSLCAPPRLYNQIAILIADQMHSDAVELARLLALVNTAMADAGIAIWESKFHYELWRPVTAIRTAGEDGNPATDPDAAFRPLGAPASNLTGPNFTPPFPSYPSGHAGFGGALFQILRRFYERDDIAFTFVSDELNGVTVDREGNVRPLSPRHFNTLSEAEEENGQSRIYLGIHWSFDKREGIAQGRRVADHVFDHAFVPN